MDTVTLTYRGQTIGTGTFGTTLSYADKMQKKSTTATQVATYEDCTDVFKKGYNKYYKPAINSNNELVRDKGVMEFMAYVEGVAGTKLPSDDIKNILHQCRKSTHRMKINKFGRNFGKRKNPEKTMGDLYVK
jgi:glycerol-3-phosphate dehydrogenase